MLLKKIACLSSLQKLFVKHKSLNKTSKVKNDNITQMFFHIMKIGFGEKFHLENKDRDRAKISTIFPGQRACMCCCFNLDLTVQGSP